MYQTKMKGRFYCFWHARSFKSGIETVFGERLGKENG